MNVHLSNMNNQISDLNGQMTSMNGQMTSMNGHVININKNLNRVEGKVIFCCTIDYKGKIQIIKLRQI